VKRLAVTIAVVVAVVLIAVLLMKAGSRFETIKARDEAVKDAMK
jgi:hypothetical protein